jgi:cysteine desulfurase
MAHLDRPGRGPGLPARPIYLDYNATTPVDPLVLEALLPALERDFGNPSSAHAFGDAPRRALGLARARVAALVGAAPDQVVFTAGGTESDALAIQGTVRAALARQPDLPPHVVTQTTEHPAVLAACATLEHDYGVAVTYLPVDRDGLVDPAAVEAALRPETVLVSLMAANNETGTLQPVREVGAITGAYGVLLHVDAAQAAGKVEVDVASWGADLLTVVGHKMYAPKGIGALYVAPGVTLRPLVAGGGQERGLRAGTENVALAVALGAAADLARAELAAGRPEVLAGMRDLLEARLAAGLPGRVRLNGHRERRLPQTLNVSIDGLRGHELLAAVPDVAASTGSACHAGADAPSPVLVAMGLGPERAMAAVRLTLGRWSTPEDVCAAADLLARAAGRLTPPGPPVPVHT